MAAKNSQKRFSARVKSANRAGVVPVRMRAGIESTVEIRARSDIGGSCDDQSLCSAVAILQQAVGVCATGCGTAIKGNIKEVMLLL